MLLLAHPNSGIFQVRQVLSKDEKPLDWVGSSKRDFLAFPAAVKDELGNALGLAQFGSKHPNAKPWKGQGPGVFEAVETYDGDAYRAVYTVRFPEVVYVLHAFQKKSPSGVRTARTDVELIARRLRLAQQDYEARHGKARG
jgi:phage-related protein